MDATVVIESPDPPRRPWYRRCGGVVYNVTIAPAVRTWRGFRDFMFHAKVLELAVGIVIGNAFSTLITTIVNDWAQPSIAVILKDPNPVSEACIYVRGQCFRYGNTALAVVSFFTVCSTVYFVVVFPLHHLVRAYYNDEYGTKQCAHCMSMIHVRAMRCPCCTMVVDEHDVLAEN